MLSSSLLSQTLGPRCCRPARSAAPWRRSCSPPLRGSSHQARRAQALARAHCESPSRWAPRTVAWSVGEGTAALLGMAVGSAQHPQPAGAAPALGQQLLARVEAKRRWRSSGRLPLVAAGPDPLQCQGGAQLLPQQQAQPSSGAAARSVRSRTIRQCPSSRSRSGAGWSHPDTLWRSNTSPAG